MLGTFTGTSSSFVGSGSVQFRLDHRRTIRLGVLVVFLPVLVVVAGCATYMRADSTFEHRRSGLVVDLPAGWLRYTPARPIYAITRDGLRLEAITISVTKVGEKIKGTERSYRANMLPNEVAELSLGVIEARDVTKNFEVKAIEPAKLAGHDGYQASAAFTDPLGLRKRLLLHGAVINGYVVEMMYEAAERVYFDKYVDAYRKVVSSARTQ